MACAAVGAFFAELGASAAAEGAVAAGVGEAAAGGVALGAGEAAAGGAAIGAGEAAAGGAAIGAGEAGAFGAASAGELAAASAADATAYGTGAGAFGFDAGAYASTGAGLAGSDIGSVAGWSTSPSFEALGGSYGSGGFGLSDLGSFYKSYVSPAMSAFSGINGLMNAEEQKKRAAMASMLADPYGASGGRAQAQGQLSNLMNDPSQVAANDPAYKLRIQAAQRAMATHGQGSGAMGVAAANASTDWYNARLAQLGPLAGAQFSPAQAQQIAMQGYQGASNTTSQALGSLGFAGQQLAGQNTASMPPAVRQWLAQQAMVA